MKKILSLLFTFIFATVAVWAQKADGTVQSLINAEQTFNSLVFKKGINKAFLKYADEKGVVFEPSPIEINKFYGSEPIPCFKLEWKPEYAMVSKKGDIGFTTGPYEFSDGIKTNFGHYISVWKNVYGKWKLILDAGVTHPKPKKQLPYEYYDPKDLKYPRLLGPKKLQMREDIVMSTDVLLGKALSISGNKNLPEFYDDKVRLYFPNNYPVIGKTEVVNFIKKNKLTLQCKPLKAERAMSGDIAYTYGEATVNKKKYHYVRIWKQSEKMKWNIIFDAYMPN